MFTKDGEIQIGSGDMVFTPMGEFHKIEALTMVKIVWFEGPLQGQKRKGHLHDDPEEKKKMDALDPD